MLVNLLSSNHKCKWNSKCLKEKTGPKRCNATNASGFDLPSVLGSAKRCCATAANGMDFKKPKWRHCFARSPTSGENVSSITFGTKSCSLSYRKTAIPELRCDVLSGKMLVAFTMEAN